MIYVSKNNNYLKYLCSVSGEKFARVAHNFETEKLRQNPPAINRSRSYTVATVCVCGDRKAKL